MTIMSKCSASKGLVIISKCLKLITAVCCIAVNELRLTSIETNSESPWTCLCWIDVEEHLEVGHVELCIKCKVFWITLADNLVNNFLILCIKKTVLLDFVIVVLNVFINTSATRNVYIDVPFTLMLGNKATPARI